MTEEWKIIADHPDYEVSNLGRVRRATDSIVAMPNGGFAVRAKAGTLKTIGVFKPRPRWGRAMTLPYLQVSLRVKGAARPFYVHRLVAKAFIPNPDNKPCVNHINFDVSDARAENLEWCTRKENSLHSYLAGRCGLPSAKRVT